MNERRIRLDQPNQPRRGLRVSYDPEKFGRTTERIARFLGTGRYLVFQTIVIILWMTDNAIPGLPHFDEYPYQFLTLVLSLQAAYAAPLILLAQNRQDDRDRVNLEADRGQARQSMAELDYISRELASVRLSIGEVVTRDFLRSELARALEELNAEGAPENGGKDARRKRKQER